MNLDVCSHIDADAGTVWRGPSERVYPTWQSCTPSGSLYNNRKPVLAPPHSLAQSAHVNIILESKCTDTTGFKDYTIFDNKKSDVLLFVCLWLPVSRPFSFM